MEIIPAIDLLKGNCVRLFQGNYEKVTEFNTNPVQQALLWQGMGAKLLHVVDLDGAKEGIGQNDEELFKIKNALSIPLQIGGGIRDLKRAEFLLKKNIDRIILGTAALEDPVLISTLSMKYPGQIIVGIDAKDGYVATRGWLEKSKVKAQDLVQDLAEVNIAGIIYTDIAKDGTLAGPNLNQLRNVASVSKVPVIASGGIGSIEDIISLKSLEELGVSAVIVGRAIYEKNIDLAEAIKVAQNLDLDDGLQKEILHA